jgi:hypothetical protein
MDPNDRRSGERDELLNEEPGRAPGGHRTAGGTTGGTAGQGAGGADVGGMSGLAFAGLGFQFAASLVAFYYLGQWLDRRLGTAPVFLFGCVLAGSGASFFLMYRQMMNAQRREDAARVERRRAGTPPKGPPLEGPPRKGPPRGPGARP